MDSGELELVLDSTFELSEVKFLGSESLDKIGSVQFNLIHNGRFGVIPNI